MPILALYMGVAPPMWISSRIQARHVITSPQSQPPSLMDTDFSHSPGQLLCTTTAWPSHPWRHIQTTTLPHSQLLQTPTLSTHQGTNRHHIPKRSRTFWTMHNQTASWVCCLLTPLSFSPSVPSASDTTGTPCWSFSAQPHTPGMTNTTHYVRGSTRPFIPEMAVPPCAASGSATVAAMRSMITCTTAQDAAHSPTEPANALEHRKHHPLTLYNTSAWEHALRRFKLTTLFPSLIHSLRHGFIVEYPIITYTQPPPNSTSIPLYQNEFEDIVKKEIAKNRYIGPTPLATIESLLGPYQTSPLSMIPKPG